MDKGKWQMKNVRWKMADGKEEVSRQGAVASGKG